jgi:hypothetical protein
MAGEFPRFGNGLGGAAGYSGVRLAFWRMIIAAEF